MADKIQEDYQQELAQLFVRAGEKQFLLRVYKQYIADENDALNTINQKIETLQKSFRTFLAQKSSQMQAVPSQPEVTTNAAPSSEAV